MKFQVLFSGKSKENIINLSSAESAHSMVSAEAVEVLRFNKS